MFVVGHASHFLCAQKKEAKYSMRWPQRQYVSLPRKKIFEIGLDCIFRRSPFEGILLRVERVVFCLEWILQHIRINTGQEKHKPGG